MLLNEINKVNKTLKNYSKKWSKIAFLARTHGQAASPSTLGKEFKVYSSRIDRELKLLKAIKPLAKFSGATGNFHTFELVDDSVNWPKVNKQFLKNLKLNKIYLQHK